jgi:vesicle coat complex subunit
MRKVVLVVAAVAVVAAVGLLAWRLGGKKTKSTPQLIADLNSADEKDRIVAARLLPDRKADSGQTIPALIGALKDKDADVRRSAAIGLGHLGGEARDAIPALEALLKDKDARVREAASVALSRIDPSKFTHTSKPGVTAKK